MTALPGGSADKVGNRYEDWWTLMRFADILDGIATRIRLEPPSDEGRGVEFWVDVAGTRSFEQAKDRAKTWTPRQLTESGVLASVQAHLAAGHRVRLVVSTPAEVLATLSARAPTATDLDDFVAMLGDEHEADLDNLRAVWNVEREEAWEYLSRIDVEHLTSDELRRLVHQRYQRLVQGDADAAVNALRGWLTDQLQKELTAPEIWAYLQTAGFPRRLLVGDASTLNALVGTVERQRRHVNARRPALGMVDQPYVDDLVTLLGEPEGPQIVVLHGRAGSGKSTVAAAAIERLSASGWFCAAVRMDTATAATISAAALGRDASLTESPAILLDGVADGSPALALVDQLDAVSLYGGRMPDSFESVAELLDEIRLTPNVKAVLVVRTVDLHEDQRMRHLLSDETRVRAVEIGDLDVDKVKQALSAAGIDPGSISATTLELLRVPLHFAVFSRLPEKARTVAYRTVAELYERFTADVRLSVERDIGHLDWPKITSALVEHLSRHQTLSAPVAVLDGPSTLEVDQLVSAGVLVRESGQFSFFHETYFDFLFARSFVMADRDLHDFLVESGQHLFRRGQTRQVLEYLAATDRPRFRGVVRRLLESDQIRPHLRAVVVNVLRQLDATAEDWAALESLAFEGTGAGERLIPLLSMPGWFDAADANRRWETWLTNPDIVDRARYQLVWAARERPSRVAELVMSFIGTSEDWRGVLRAIIQWSLRPELVGLAVTLTERGDLDDARGPIAVNSDFFSMLYGLHKDDPAGTSQIVGAYFRRHISRAAAEGSADPFKSGHLPDGAGSAAEVIHGIAEATPQTFLDELLPALVQV